MLIKEDSVILNYINKYGIVEQDTTNINKLLKEEYIISLINKLYDHVELKNKKIEKKIQQFEIIDEYQLPMPSSKPAPVPVTKDLESIKKNIREIIDIINDTEKIYTRLYNLELGLIFLINFDKTSPNYPIYTDLYKTEVEKDNYLLDFFRIVFKDIIEKDKKKYTPLKYEKFTLDLDNLTLEQLNEITRLLIEKEKTLKDAIANILTLSDTINIQDTLNQQNDDDSEVEETSLTNRLLDSALKVPIVNKTLTSLSTELTSALSSTRPVVNKALDRALDVPIVNEAITTLSNVAKKTFTNNNEDKEMKQVLLEDDDDDDDTYGYRVLDNRSLFLPVAKPVDPKYNPLAKDVLFGGTNVYETINKLSVLNTYVDKLTSLSLEYEIPSGINLEFDEIRKIINSLKIKLELQAHENNTPIQDDKKFKKIEFNLFEDIPDYTRMKFGDKFITNPLNPSLPRDDIAIKNIYEILQVINAKKIYFDEKIANISSIIANINIFDEKIKLYIDKEIDNSKGLKFTFSDIGEKKDIADNKKKIEEVIKEYTQELEKEKLNLPLLQTQEFIDYLVLKNNYKPVADFNDDVLEIKNLIAQGLEPGTPVVDSNGNIIDKIKNYLDKVFLVRDINYPEGFFLNDDNYSNFEQLFNLFEAFKNKTGNLQRSQVGPLISKSGLDSAAFMRVFTKFQKNSVGDDSKDYKPIATKLSILIPKYKKDKVDISKITSVETANPIFLDKFNSIKDTFDFTDIPKSIASMIENINIKIKENEENIVINKKKIEELTTSLSSYKDIKYETLLKINDSIFDTKVELLHNKIKEINKKITAVFKLKDGTEPTTIIEGKIPMSGKNINKNWFSKLDTVPVTDISPSISGGANFRQNLDNLLQINDLNNEMKLLILKAEKYKSYASDLLDKYVSLIKQLQEIVIYVYYKLTALKDINIGRSKIKRQFNQESLNILLNNIKNINRKNFGLLKEVYINVIENILSQQKTKELEKKEYKFVVFNISNINSLINLFVLTHIENNVSTF